MKPEMSAKHDASGRVIECRMSGMFNEADMLVVAATIRKETDLMLGRRHIVVADMRGMKAVHPSIARHLGEAIGYQRARGCVLCVHVSDDTVQRLQARRVARQYSETDDVTVEVDSMEEARRVVKSYERFLDDPKFAASIRSAVDTGGI